MSVLSVRQNAGIEMGTGLGNLVEGGPIVGIGEFGAEHDLVERKLGSSGFLRPFRDIESARKAPICGISSQKVT
jgi:hypothetical protein